MGIKAIAAIFVAASAPAQIYNLATTSDGRDLYFETSLRQRGSSQDLTDKLFLLRDRKLTLVEQSPGPGLAGPSAYLYQRMSLSASGTVRAVNRMTTCFGGSSCFFRELAGTEILTPTGRISAQGFASVSPNGRYALLYGNTSSAPGTTLAPGSARLLDLTTGQTTLLGPQAARDGQMVADDGRALIGRAGGGVRLVNGTKTIDLAPTRTISRALLSSDAARIVYEGESEIRVLDVATGADRALGPGRVPMLAQDGHRISYLSTNGAAQVWLTDAVTGVSAALSHEPEGIADQTISGDGSIAYAATNSGRLISIATAGGTVTQLLGSPGAVGRLRTPVVPGSYNEVIGGLEQEILIGGAPVATLGRTAQGFAFQVPWETEPGDETETVLRGPEPAWEQLLSKGVWRVAGEILALIHEDWSALITPELPARPGEIVSLYGTGYGPVDGFIPTGQPTPTDRLFRMTTPCDWRATGAGFNPKPFEVLFAGLAPTLTGIYQFSLRIPRDWPDPIFAAYCQLSGDNIIYLANIDVKP